MLNQIKAKIECQLKREGISAEITFINGKYFSLFCEEAAQFCKAKDLMDAASQNYESEDCDPEIGFFAYYKF